MVKQLTYDLGAPFDSLFLLKKDPELCFQRVLLRIGPKMTQVSPVSLWWGLCHYPSQPCSPPRFSHENSSHFSWLAVDLPLLKNISQLKSVGVILPNIWKNKTCSKPPTSQPFIGHWVTDLQGSHGSPPAPHARPQPWSGRWVSRRPEAPGMEVAESARKHSGTSPTKPEITWDFPTKTNQHIGFTYNKHGS